VVCALLVVVNSWSIMSPYSIQDANALLCECVHMHLMPQLISGQLISGQQWKCDCCQTAVDEDKVGAVVWFGRPMWL
jgi:hypothetical protein